MQIIIIPFKKVEKSEATAKPDGIWDNGEE